MYHVNNFTRPAENTPSIELSCGYDGDLSHWEFKENFKILQHQGYRTLTKAFYIDYGSLPDDDSITFKIKATPEQKAEFFKKEGYSEEDVPPVEDMDEAILDTYGERITLLNYQDFNQCYAPIQVEPSKRVEWVAIRGYSQGDYAEIAYCPDDYAVAFGCKPDESELQKLFERLFYGAPIYCVFRINGAEYNYSELMPDCYEWEPEAFAQIVSEKSGVEKQTLLDMLPKYPD